MALDRITSWFLYLLIFSATMEAWLYNFGIRLIAHDIFALIFVVFFTLSSFSTRLKPFIIEKNLKIFLMLWSFYFIFQVLSVLGLLWFGSDNFVFQDKAWSQFALGLSREIYILCFFWAFGIFLCRIEQQQRKWLVNIFISGVVLGGVYQLISIYMYIFKGVNLDSILWPAISIGLPADFTTLQTGLISQFGTTLIRGGGFLINPNAFASVLVCVIPYFLLKAIHENKAYIFLFLFSVLNLIVTISRSGYLACAIALFVLFIFEFKTIFNRFKTLSLLIISTIIISFILYGEILLYVLVLRLKGGLGEREHLISIGIENLEKTPFFGMGFNTSSVLLTLLNTEPNFHNFWLIKAVELGLLGFMAYGAFYFWVLKTSYQSKTLYGRALFSSLCGLSISGFFNNTLASFYIQIFIILFFAVMSLEGKEKINQNQVKTNAS